MPQAGVQDAQIIINLGDGADRRARALAGRLLFDTDGRRQTADVLDLGFLHLAEELAGISRQRFDVAALALGIDRIQGEGAFAGAARTAEDRHLFAWQHNIDVLEVVLLGALNGQLRAQERRSAGARQRRSALPRSCVLALARSTQNRAQRLTGVGMAAIGHFFGSAAGDHLAAAAAAVGAQIDDPVGGLDDI